jgi:putative transposase
MEGGAQRRQCIRTVRYIPPSAHPHRTRPAHFPTLEAGSRSVIIFLTVCTKGRRPLLANHEAAQLLSRTWAAANVGRVGRYVILPDHVHLFCAPNTFPPQPLKNWVSFWKNSVTRPGPNRDEVAVWQPDYWDRPLRRSESCGEKWEYVASNPVRHGYVSHAEDWPYRGELNVLEWHDESPPSGVAELRPPTLIY